jgi:hypothetical protein
MRTADGVWGALIAAQCAGVVFLVFQSLRAPSSTPAPAPSPAAPAATILADPGGPLSDEERLRQIIREELAALGSVTAPAPAPALTAAPRDPGKDRTQRELVAGQIAHYRSVGRISETEMAGLQQDIAQLDPASRRELLNELTRAMNAKEIKGLM